MIAHLLAFLLGILIGVVLGILYLVFTGELGNFLKKRHIIHSWDPWEDGIVTGTWEVSQRSYKRPVQYRICNVCGIKKIRNVLGEG